MPNDDVEIVGYIELGSSEEAAYAETNARVDELESNAVMLNGEFDDDAGWWKQVQNGHDDDFGDKRADSVFVHKRELAEVYKTLDVSPAIVTQTFVSYSHDGGENFTRMTSAYHELIANGTVRVTQEQATPNFTPIGTSIYNKFKGNCGVNGIIARIDDVHYFDHELEISPNDTEGTTGIGTSKSCGIGAIVQRRSDYAQGRHRASYSIGGEFVVYNLAEEDGVEGTDGYYGNDELFSYKTWTNCLHLVGGARRPVTAGILINGKSSLDVSVDADGMPVKDGAEKVLKDVNGNDRVEAGKAYVRNGMYSGIYIGASAMRIRSVPLRNANGDLVDKNGNTVTTPVMTTGNSHETAAINTSNWTEKGSHGFTFLKAGYAPRILTSRGSALFESSGAKFLNPDGSMPFAISCVDTYTYKDENEQIQTARGVPYLDFKIGTSSVFYNDGIPVERPADTTRSRIGYVSTSNSMNVSSDGGIKFNVNRNFSSASTTGKIYTMTSTDFSPTTPLKLGNIDSKWETVYSKMGAVNAGDSTEIKANPVVIENGEATDEKTKILTAWGNLKYKMFEFTGTSTIKHFGLVAQDIISAFTAQELNAVDYGIIEAKTENNVTTYSVRYNECLALECAYLRSQLAGA